MARFAYLFLFIFGVSFSVAAQQSMITYPHPFTFKKINGRLVTEARIAWKGDRNHLAIELDGTPLKFESEGDSVALMLPLVGKEGVLSFRERGLVVSKQRFTPYIPDDWGYFGNGTIDIINTSHQDIAWMNTPDSCREERIHKIIIPALQMAEKNPGFGFGMEQTLNLRELLDEYPQYKPVVEEAYKKGIFSWGATFNQPYEGILSDEQLVRELYQGRKWMHTAFDGNLDSKTAFNMDVPGRAAQFPQVLSRAGVKYLVVSRMKEGFFNWFSPDGSHVLTYSPGNYGWASMFYKYFDEDAPTAMHKISNVLRNWDQYYASRHIPPHFGVVISNDAAGPIYYKKVIEEWNQIVDQSGVPLPRLKYSTAEDFLASVDSPEARFDSISGERPNLWLYIHGPAHYEAIKAKKAAGVHLPDAEMFSTLNCVLNNDFSGYPQKALDSAWYQSIYDDHGWGGKHGDITDSIFSADLHQADAISRNILYKALDSIADKVHTAQTGALIVFNGLWKRNGMVAVTVPGSSKYTVTDANGTPLVTQNTPDGDSTKVSFMTHGVPSIGYSTFYLSQKKAVTESNHQVMSNFCENKYYRIELGDGGITRLYDKQLKKEILNTTRFAGGDVMDLGYDGNGAGEFTEITPTNMNRFDKLSNHKTAWKIKEDGNLFTTFEATYRLNQVEIIQQIRVFHQEKKIELEYRLPDWPGVKGRQLRMALPVNAGNASISYDVPMGVSTVDQSELNMRPGGWAWGGTYWQKPSEIHPREVQNFVSASAAGFGLTMSSRISVFDWIDPTVDAVHYPVIQAILLSTHKSCHGQGNWYLQKGAHVFRFSITSHPPGWRNGYPFGIENNHPLYVVEKQDQKGSLPSSLSFIETSSPFITVTAFKKSATSNQAVLRLVEMKGANENASVRFYPRFRRIQKVNLIEEDPGAVLGDKGNTLHLKVGRNSVDTYQIDFKP